MRSTNHWSIVELEAYLRGDPPKSEVRPGRWLPARPFAMHSLRRRIRVTWLVWTGRADALTWTPEDAASAFTWPTPSSGYPPVPPPPMRARSAALEVEPTAELRQAWRRSVIGTLNFVASKAASLRHSIEHGRHREGVTWSSVEAELNDLIGAMDNRIALVNGEEVAWTDEEKDQWKKANPSRPTHNPKPPWLRRPPAPPAPPSPRPIPRPTGGDA